MMHWKCDYCGSLNDRKYTSCVNCSGPKIKKNINSQIGNFINRLFSLLKKNLWIMRIITIIIIVVFISIAAVNGIITLSHDVSHKMKEYAQEREEEKAYKEAIQNRILLIEDYDYVDVQIADCNESKQLITVTYKDKVYHFSGEELYNMLSTRIGETITAVRHTFVYNNGDIEEEIEELLFY